MNEQKNGLIFATNNTIPMNLQEREGNTLNTDKEVTEQRTQFTYLSVSVKKCLNYQIRRSIEFGYLWISYFVTYMLHTHTTRRT